MLGKKYKDYFLIGKARKARQPLKLMHINIYGLVKVELIKHKRYILIFVDGFTTKVGTFSLGKLEAFRKFREFKAFVGK